MRKFSLVLAFLLALTAVGPVRTAAAETVMRSEIALVDVTVPETGRIVLNPYGLPVEIDGETTQEQIASQTMPITNNGETPVVVSASATGRISEHSSMAFAAAPPPADGLEKEIFMYAEFQNEDGRWMNGYKGRSNQVLITETASRTKEVLTLDAGAGGVFRLFGATAVSPADPWSGADEVSVSFAFTFVPVIEPAETASEEEPSEEPAAEPSEEPSAEPSEEPATEPSEEPTTEPSDAPAGPSKEEEPSKAPEPSEEPTTEPSEEPVAEPSEEPLENENQDPAPTDGEERVETDGDTDPDQPETGQL